MRRFEKGLRAKLSTLVQSKSSRIAIVMSVIIFGSLLAATSSLAWSKEYVRNTTLQAGWWRYTGWAPNIDWNVASWGTGGGTLAMKTTLCRPDDFCYVVSESFSGYISDSRTISYGDAWCGTEEGNPNSTYVYTCYAQNPSG